MDPRELHTAVAGLFAGSARTTRVGIEHELLTGDASCGDPASIEVVRAAVAGTWYAPYVGFEPGGQVELSLPVGRSADRAVDALTAAVTALRSDCARAGVCVDAEPVDGRPAAQVPLQLRSPRYLAMQRHFDTIGPAGRRMMRRTASTQVCLDWWPGAAGLEQWRVLNLAGPFLAAAFARSTGPGGRLATWLAVDPGRTAFDDRLLHDEPVAAYADFAMHARVFTTPGDVGEHLTTLFPPIRPRGSYLEVRFLDVQPEAAVGGVVSALARLMYDDEHRRQVLCLLAGEAVQLADLWRRAADGDPEIAERGRVLAGLVAAPEQVSAA